MKRLAATLTALIMVVAAVAGAGYVLVSNPSLLVHLDPGTRAAGGGVSTDQVVERLFTRPGSEPQAGHPWVLVVGDSVSSGLTLSSGMIGRLVAYPTIVQQQLGADWHVTVDACPGETTTDFVGACPFAFLEPWMRGRSLRDIAHSLIADHRGDLRAIVVELGANDLFNARRDHIPASRAIASATAGLDNVVSDLHAAAPSVPIVVANAYDPYPQRSDVGALVAVHDFDAGLGELVADVDGTATVADFFSAVDAAPAGVCSAVDCADHDIHPTQLGHERLAEAVMDALRRVGIKPPRGILAIGGAS